VRGREPAAGHQQDAAGDREHRRGPLRRRRLGEEQRGGDGDDQRRGAARDRIDLAEVAVGIGPDQEQFVAAVERRAEQQPKPGRPRRRVEEGDQGDRDRALDESEQHDRREAVHPQLHDRVPAGVEHGGEQDGEEDAERHRRLRYTASR
jgi:hypothetical protein